MTEGGFEELRVDPQYVEEGRLALIGELEELVNDPALQSEIEGELIPLFHGAVLRVLERFNQQVVNQARRHLRPRIVNELCDLIDEELAPYADRLGPETSFAALLPRIAELRNETREALLAPFYEFCRDLLAAKGIRDKSTLIAGKGAVRRFLDMKFETFGRGQVFASEILGESVGRTLRGGRSTLRRIADRVGLPLLTEENKAFYREILIKAGYPDQWTVLFKGLNTFRDTEFEGIELKKGKGDAFVKTVLAHEVGGNNIITEDLKRMLNALDMPKYTEETKAMLRGVFAVRGLIDERTLLAANMARDFKGLDFGHLRQGMQGVEMARYLLMRTVPDTNITKSILREMLKILELPEIHEDTKQHYRDVLAAHGYPGRKSLLVPEEGKKFRAKKFGKYKGGRKFFGTIMGKPLPKRKYLEDEHMVMLADFLYPVRKAA